MLTYWETLIATRSNIALSDSYAQLWGKKAQNNYTVETYTGTLPAELENTVAGSLVSYKIWGNTGGVGAKKTNLADGEQLLRNASMGTDGTIVTISSNFAFRLIPIVEGKTYSIINIYGGERSTASNFFAFFEELPQIGSVPYNKRRYSFKTPSKTFAAPINGYLATSDYYPMYEEQHLNLIPLEVYEGNASPYYLPIISSSETTNIYIGRVALGKDEYVDSESWKIYRWASITGLSEPLCGIGTYVDSLDLSTGVLTRRIKKLVLTGAENWVIESVDNFYADSVIAGAMFTATVVCSHQVSVNTHHSAGVANIWISRTGKLNFTTNVISHTVDDFKSFLATQYAVGTPVTVWYVLAEPETSTIPVPSGLTGTIEGYLIQDGTPAPENPIYPTANGVKQTDGTYTIENAYLAPTDPPEPPPEIPTFAGETTISYGGGTGAQPEKVEFEYEVKR